MQRCMEQIGPITEMLGLVSLDCLAVEINEVIEVMVSLTGRSLKAEAMERIFRIFASKINLIHLLGIAMIYDAGEYDIVVIGAGMQAARRHWLRAWMPHP